MEEKKIKVNSLHDVLRGSESLLRTKEVLDEMKIDFFLIHGTLLGIYRDGYLCPYETPSGRGDIDVASFDEMPDSKFDEFTKVVEDHGLKMFEIYGKIGNNVRVVGAYIRGTPWYIGVEFWKKLPDEDKVMTYDGLVTSPSSFFETFKEIKYLGKTFKIPGDTEGFLEYNYGENWKIPCVQAIVGNRRVWVKCDPSGEVLEPLEVMDDISDFYKGQIIKKIS